MKHLIRKKGGNPRRPWMFTCGICRARREGQDFADVLARVRNHMKTWH